MIIFLHELHVSTTHSRDVTPREYQITLCPYNTRPTKLYKPLLHSLTSNTIFPNKYRSIYIIYNMYLVRSIWTYGVYIWIVLNRPVELASFRLSN